MNEIEKMALSIFTEAADNSDNAIETDYTPEALARKQILTFKNAGDNLKHYKLSTVNDIIKYLGLDSVTRENAGRHQAENFSPKIIFARGNGSHSSQGSRKITFYKVLKPGVKKDGTVSSRDLKFSRAGVTKGREVAVKDEDWSVRIIDGELLTVRIDDNTKFTLTNKKIFCGVALDKFSHVARSVFVIFYPGSEVEFALISTAEENKDFDLISKAFDVMVDYI